MTKPFRFEKIAGRAGSLHGRSVAGATVPTVTRLHVSTAAVVLGSTQPEGVVDSVAAASDNVDVVRRRSGGGAVWLDPDSSHWIDVTIGSDDDQWSADVGAAFVWIGERFAAALTDQGINAVVTRTRTPAEEGPPANWSSLMCFGGRGMGEVFVDDRKFLGMSQRRVRDRARFQLVMYDVWNPARLLRLLVTEDRVTLERDAEVFGIGCRELSVDPDRLVTAAFTT